LLGRLRTRAGMWISFLARRSQEDALFDRLTKPRSPTTKFVVQFDIFMHEVTAMCLKYIPLVCMKIWEFQTI
jgi:hypothetical protein